MSRFRLAVIAVVAGYLALYVAPLGVRPMVTPDEARYAEIPREMIASGDWVVPRLDGFEYFEKPVLGYWAVAASFLGFGENRFALRLPFALATGAAALILGTLVGRFGGGRWPGLAAATAYLTCGQVYGLGTFAVFDALLAMLLVGVLACFYLAYAQPRRGQRHAWLALAGVFCGLAFLTKGFLAFVVPAIAIGPFLAWERRWKALAQMGWIPLGAAVAVSLPWSLAVAVRDPGFWDFFFWNEHIARFTSGATGQHRNPFWYLLPFLFVGALPWTILALPAGKQLARDRPLEPFVRYCLCWLVVPFLFFSASSGKLGTYVQPCFAPLVALIVIGVLRTVEERRRLDLWIASCMVGLAAALLGIAILVQLLVGVVDLESAYLPREAWKGYVGGVGLLVCAAVAATAWPARRSGPRFAVLAAATFVMFSLVPVAFPARIDDKIPEARLARDARLFSPDAIVVAEQHLVHVVCWVFKRDDVYIMGSGELGYGAARRPHRALDGDGLRRMIADPQRRRPLVLVVRPELAGALGHLGQPQFSESQRGVVIRVY